MTHPFDRRRGGVLCPISALPGKATRGTLGESALRFLDFVARAGLGVWQVLPLNPPDRYGSPYHSDSVFALDPSLVADWTPEAILAHARHESDACARFRAANAFWLDDYVCFALARSRHGPDWTQWPAPLRDRDATTLAALLASASAAQEALLATQFVASTRWQALRRAANERGLIVFGDLPLYPAHASADVWAQPRWFQLDTQGRAERVAGVPPDYFSTEGQRWGNPLYDWPRLAADGYRWWCERIAAQLALFDVVRIDHFRGLESYWAIPADGLAVDGSWQPGPGAALLETIAARQGSLPLVAEDLGVITPAVDALRERFHLPGMRVLQFAFSGDPRNPHLPSQHRLDTVVYTGTHDNDTAIGWYSALPSRTRNDVDALLVGRGAMPWALIGLAFDSPARTAIVPLQDFLELGSEARFNTPGTTTGNWRWRFDQSALTEALATRIRAALARSNRLG
jgi:4-alpha-glucanotransferase